MRRDTAGFTILELLVAGFILTVVLTLSATFLARQSDLNRRTQAKAEVQDKVRMIMQLVSSDLAIAGANVYADSSGALQNVTPGLSTCPTVGTGNSCLVSWNSGGGADTRDHLAATFISTLYPPADACREVAYRFNGSDLERFDRKCTGSHIDPTSTDFDTLATNVLALDVRYICSNGVALAAVPNTTSCPVGDAYLRSAVVSVVARSDVSVGTSAVQTFEIDSAATGTPYTVSCEQDFYCSSLTQEVLLPNLKDR